MHPRDGKFWVVSFVDALYVSIRSIPQTSKKTKRWVTQSTPNDSSKQVQFILHLSNTLKRNKMKTLFRFNVVRKQYIITILIVYNYATADIPYNVCMNMIVQFY